MNPIYSALITRYASLFLNSIAAARSPNAALPHIAAAASPDAVIPLL